MGRHLKINLGGETIILTKTRAEVLADRSVNEQDRRVYLALLDQAESQHDRIRVGGTPGAANSTKERRNRRPNLEKLKRRR